MTRASRQTTAFARILLFRTQDKKRILCETLKPCLVCFSFRLRFHRFFLLCFFTLHIRSALDSWGRIKLEYDIIFWQY